MDITPIIPNYGYDFHNDNSINNRVEMMDATVPDLGMNNDSHDSDVSDNLALYTNDHAQLIANETAVFPESSCDMNHDVTTYDVDASSPSKSSIGLCRSIDEASVCTKTEIVMDDPNYHDRLTDNDYFDGDHKLDNDSHDGQKLIVSNSSQPKSIESKEDENCLDDVHDSSSICHPPSLHGKVIDIPDSKISEEVYDPPHHGNVLIRLTPEENQLFQLLINAAEAHEKGVLKIDPNPNQHSLSARGGFTKGDLGDDDNISWLTLPPQVDRIEIRIAGGWVRDKLLNQHSSDVDVALDCMMGVQFARIVQSYLIQESQAMDDNIVDEHGNESSEEHESKRDGVILKGDHKKKHKLQRKQPKIGVIGANPSQSKHLETATMTIYGLDIDFVNLRAEEVYDSNSRIPTSQTRNFGSPLEDALRRDFTINSLFYNIRTQKIEDWTGRGLDDLFEHRRIVTPVNAHETFHDDPLRVLRAIRFCVRLDYTLDNQLEEAAMSKRVHHSLHVKVSRERVGKELEGMLTGKGARPGHALDMIARLHLAGSVFCFPGSFPSDHDYLAGGPVTGHILGLKYHGCLGNDGPDAVELAASHRARGWEESKALLGLLPRLLECHSNNIITSIKERKTAEDDREQELPSPSEVDKRLLHLCLFISPFRNLTFPDAKGRTSSVTTHMIKESLKFPTRDIQAVSSILNHVDEMSGLLLEWRCRLAMQHQEKGGVSPDDVNPPCRLKIGLLVRSLKEHWVTCLLTAAAWEIRSLQRNEVDDGALSINFLEKFSAEQPSLEFYRLVVNELKLDECWKIRPHLNGKEIISLLNLPKGPIVGCYIEDQVRWMLLNPNGTKEECISYLLEQMRRREKEAAVVDDEEIPNVQNKVIDPLPNTDANSELLCGGVNCENETKHLSKKVRAEIVNSYS